MKGQEHEVYEKTSLEINNRGKDRGCCRRSEDFESQTCVTISHEKEGKSYKKKQNIPLHTHLFKNLGHNPDSNSVIGNNQHQFSDSIVSFEFATRTNNIITYNYR